MADNDGHTKVRTPSLDQDATRLQPTKATKPSNGASDKTQVNEETQANRTQANETQVKTAIPNGDATRVQPKASAPKLKKAKSLHSQTTLQKNEADTPTVINDEETRVVADSVTDSVSTGGATGGATLGDTLNNRFYLESLLGSGGMGDVYAAQDRRRVEMKDDDTHVALKLLKEEFRTHSKFMIALQRESKKVQLLSHPNIVTVYDFDRDGDAAYISMEYLKGSSLDRLVFPRTLSTQEALYIIERMARGLAYAHQEGYVHADFKPANVFYTDDQQVKVLDFGIAQAVIKDKEGYRNASQVDKNDPTMYALTPNYASLEMLKGEQPLPGDDIYSLCCVAYELLTGKHPYTDEDGNKITAAEAQALDLSPGSIDGLPRTYARALRKGLSFKREDRFENAGAFLDATKPKITKIQIVALAFISLVSVLSYFGVDTWQAKKVPSLNSLDSSLANSVSMIQEGDAMFTEEDIDLAHRLYSQAWDAANDNKETSTKLDKLKRIIDHRMNRIADDLINELKNPETDAFRFSQIQIALEFIQNDELGTHDKKIEKVLKSPKSHQ